ncbi:hypothetical protein JCM17846_29580 [Iodidimonas nitroreducens]|uniref:Dicarboxylate/amino acid:cation symporter n=1 Tax=Iodidimonas nitroreducens TaxID=1236968 RepID=A0A5A7NEA9_9PROT|nr:hypothetical protein JCM17846_29580 [Iodidimonas nitroreducens]
MWQSWKQMKLWKQIMIAFSLAILIGSLLKAAGLKDIAIAMQPLGLVFVNAIKMLMVPIIFTTIISGVTSLADSQKLGRMGIKTFGFYMLTTAFAVFIGLLIGGLISPGVGISLPDAASGGAGAPDPDAAMSIRDLLVGLVPANPIASMAEGNVLQIIVFALLIGLSINLAGKKGAIVRQFFDSATEVVFKLVHIIMALAPFGIFA